MAPIENPVGYLLEYLDLNSNHPPLDDLDLPPEMSDCRPESLLKKERFDPAAPHVPTWWPKDRKEEFLPSLLAQLPENKEQLPARLEDRAKYVAESLLTLYLQSKEAQE